MKYYIKVLKNYAVFEGRARRSEFWYFILFHYIVALILTEVDNACSTNLFSPIYQLLGLIPLFAVGIRRMHDTGNNGWYFAIPFYNLILAATEGDEGDNQYGSNPKYIESIEEET